MKKSWSNYVTNAGSHVYYICYSNTDEPAHFFLLVTEKDRVKLDAALADSKVLDLLDYGELITSGFGATAPEATLDWVSTYYGIKIAA